MFMKAGRWLVQEFYKLRFTVLRLAFAKAAAARLTQQKAAAHLFAHVGEGPVSQVPSIHENSILRASTTSLSFTQSGRESQLSS